MTAPYDIQAHSIAHPGINGFSSATSAGEKALLEMVTAGCAAADVLDAVSLAAEEVAHGSSCGIYLIDWTIPAIRSFWAPSLPAEFNLALTVLPLREDSGPCARAACLRIPVVAADLEADPQWQRSPFSALASSHGFRSCWSTPICAAAEVVGTLAVLHPGPTMPRPAQEDPISRLAHIASIAITLMKVEAELDKATAELAHMTEILALSASIAARLVQPISGVVINASTGGRMLAASPPNVEGARETIRRTLRDCSRASEMISRLRDILGAKATAFYAPANTD